MDGNFPFATNATYTCDQGYGQRDGIVVRVCLNDRSSNGLFNGSPAVCEGRFFIDLSLFMCLFSIIMQIL